MINTLTLHEWNYTIPRGSIPGVPVASAARVVLKAASSSANLA
jgi:hypothetical protein